MKGPSYGPASAGGAAATLGAALGAPDAEGGGGGWGRAGRDVRFSWHPTPASARANGKTRRKSMALLEDLVTRRRSVEPVLVRGVSPHARAKREIGLRAPMSSMRRPLRPWV